MNEFEKEECVVKFNTIFNINRNSNFCLLKLFENKRLKRTTLFFVNLHRTLGELKKKIVEVQVAIKIGILSENTFLIFFLFAELTAF